MFSSPSFFKLYVRPSSSPPKLRQNFPSNAPGSQTHQQPLSSGHHNSADIGSMKPTNLPVAKRTKLPFVRTSDHVIEDDSTVQDDSERYFIPNNIVAFKLYFISSVFLIFSISLILGNLWPKLSVWPALRMTYINQYKVILVLKTRKLLQRDNTNLWLRDKKL